MQTALDDRHLELLTKFVAAREKSPKMVRFMLLAASRNILQDARMLACHRYRVPEKETVDLKFSPKRKHAFYCGLMKCGLGWICPLCSVRLAEERRAMLRLGLDNARKLYLPVMVTYTVRHSKADRLIELLGGMLAAYRSMRQQRIWRTIKDEYMIEGEIRATEITYGDEGFHPHFHVVLLLRIEILKYLTHQPLADAKDSGQRKSYDVPYLVESLQRQLGGLWLAELARHGLHAVIDHALRVTSDYDELSDYVTKFGTELPPVDRKWTLSDEMTRGQHKTARIDGNISMIELLTLAAVDAPGFADLWREYASATRGKSGLQWTPGLQAKLGVKDTEGNILTDEIAEDEILLAQFDHETWQMIIRNGAEGRILDLAATGDDERVWKFIDRFRETTRENLETLSWRL